MPTDRARTPAGLLLAAGGGRRFGRPKALIAFHGEPLIRRGVRLLRWGGCAPVIVVVGARGPEAVDALDDPAVEMVHNDRWASGMGGSLRAGLARARELDAPAVVVALVDQPLVGPDVVRRLVTAWRDGATVAVASYDGVPRNPALFAARAWDAADAAATGDRGARDLLRRRPEWVQPVPCEAQGSPRDIDTRDDLDVLEHEPDPNPPPVGRRTAAKEQQWN